MIFGLFKRRGTDDTIRDLYGVIVAQARDPAFYTVHRVPDTVEGRFEMIVFHLFLVLHRLKEESPERRVVGQALFDLFFLDMDRSLRELGVGDTKVPARIRKMGEAFYGRTKVYDEALNGEDPQALAQAIARNAIGKVDADASALASYMRAAVADLAAIPYETLAKGRLSFPFVPKA